MTNPRRILYLIVPTLLVAFILVHIAASFFPPRIRLPEYEPVDTLFVLDQNWTSSEIDWYNHASQGGGFSLVIDYPWLRALERPVLPWLIFNSPGRLMDREYMSRFGFLTSRKNLQSEGVPIYRITSDGTKVAYDEVKEEGDYWSPEWGKRPFGVDQLPVGFTRTQGWVDPTDSLRRARDVVGFNCAACHTGQVDYVHEDGSRLGVRIQGGPAMTHLTNFEIAVGGALVMTYLIPTRFDRFANEVLKGRSHDPVARDSLRKQIWGLILEGFEEKGFAHRYGINSTVEGFGRLDALGRIGNFVFGKEMFRDNFIPDDAPVNFPHIWDTPWLNWIQYNASIMQPIVRNAGEAMGVFARVDFQTDTTRAFDTSLVFRSTVDVDELHQMEALIRGDSAYAGLHSPRWPSEIFGRPVPEDVAAGRRLYEQHCQGCHFPENVADERFEADTTHWTPRDPYGNRYLKVSEVSLFQVGTDRKVAANFIQRIVDLGRLGELSEPGGELYDPEFPGIGGYTWGGPALQYVVSKTVERKYDDFCREGRKEFCADTDSLIQVGDTLATLRQIYDGLRPNKIQAKLIYKARPLDGIWATPPYLHNGSVPTIYDLLSPVSERPVAFYLGSKDFDSDKIGYKSSRTPGTFLLDTRITGNSNSGHEFRGTDDPGRTDYYKDLGKGVIGPGLSETERRQLIAFLKTL